MSIAEFIALMGGILMEIGLLYGNREAQDDTQTGIVDTASQSPLAPFTIRQWALLIGGGMLLLALALNLFSFGSVPLRWLDDIFTLVAGLVLTFVVFSAVIGDRILPRVNEQQMLVVHIIVGLNVWLQGEPALPTWALIAALIPTTALVFQGLYPRVMPLTTRALFYFWYLVTLLTLSFQNGAQAYFEMITTDPLDIFAFGSILIFLGVHILVAIRFTLILSSLIVPRNRPLLHLIMPRLMTDEQMSPSVLAVLLFFVAVVIAANSWVGFAPNQTMVNVLVLVVLQFGGKFHLMSKIT